MSRAEDLKEVESQSEDLERQIDTATKDFRKYNDEVVATIRAIMDEAGVWAEVNDLETERSASQQRLQAKVQRLQGELASKRAIREFLVGRESRDTRRKDSETEESGEKSGEKDKKRPTPPA